MDKEKLTDIVKDFQNGNNEAFSKLYEEYYSVVYNIAKSVTKDEHLACDITQETFIEVFSTIKNLKEPSAFASWLKTIAYHQCTRHYKKKTVKHETHLDAEALTIFEQIQDEDKDFIPGNTLEQKELHKIISDILLQLPEEQRAAIRMYYYDGLSVKEIAEIQEVPEGTVTSRLNYARKAIKKAIEEYEKKNKTKLLAIPFIPFVCRFFEESETAAVPHAYSVQIAQSVSQATGASLSLHTGVFIGIAGKISALPLVAKIVAPCLLTLCLSVPIILNVTKKPATEPTTEAVNNIITSVSLSDNTTQTETDISTTDEESSSDSPSTTEEEKKTSSQTKVKADGKTYTSTLSHYTDNSGSSTYESGTWTNSNVFLDFTVTGGDDVELYYKASTDKAFKKYTQIIEVSEEGIKEYQFKSTTSKGKQIALHTVTVKIDKTLPELSYETNSKYSPNSIASGTASVYALNGSASISRLNSLEQLIEFENTYGSCNYSNLTGQCERDAVVQILRAKSWISSNNFNIDIFSSDALCGINNVTYSYNGKSFSSKKAEINAADFPDGVYDLTITATDLAGNQTSQTIPVKKDTVTPSTKITSSYSDGTYVNNTVSLKGTSTSGNTSPIWYTISNEPIISSYSGTTNAAYVNYDVLYSPSEYYTANGLETVYVTAYSESGICGDTQKINVLVDKESPYINITKKTETQIQAALGDDFSPIDSAYYTLNGKKTTLSVDTDTNSCSVKITLPTGENSVQIFVKDKAGNAKKYTTTITTP